MDYSLRICGYNWVDIAKENNLTNPDKLLVGQVLSIPKTPVIQLDTADPSAMTVFGEAITGGSYEVAEGDHLWGIAVRAYGDGYRWAEIANTNNIADPDIILIGTVLTIPR